MGRDGPEPTTPPEPAYGLAQAAAGLSKLEAGLQQLASLDLPPEWRRWVVFMDDKRRGALAAWRRLNKEIEEHERTGRDRPA